MPSRTRSKPGSRLVPALLVLCCTGCLTYSLDDEEVVSLRLAQGSRVCPGATPDLIASV
jgi:hypothetical protein